jgi:2-oxo-3-hexenedioate decarboxylase
MSSTDVIALANELRQAYASRQTIAAPSSREGGLDLDAAYAVEQELVRLRCADGRRTVGLKVGFANKAVWRVMKLETLVWAHMYDDTVRYAGRDAASLSLAQMCSPKIEPEIVFKMKRPLDPGTTDPAAVLASVEWIALGFEIIDCVYADWTFQPADFVAAYGLHAALVIGEPRPVETHLIPALVEALPRFTVTLSRNGELVDEGSGRNSLRSPALCLAELAAALSRRAEAQAGAGAGTSAAPLAAGDLVSSGTLTESRAIAAGETWTAAVDGLDLPTLTLHALS